MTYSCLSYDWVLLIFFHGILLMCMSSCLKSVTIPAFANETDRMALLDFKNRITKDPLQIMSSWNDSIHLCNWIGVTCSPSNKRVMVLNLTAKKLSGSIPPSIGNLTYLTGINLKDNSFNGEIPQEVGRLQCLQHLNLSSNSFGGKLPTNLSYCTQLRVLDVAFNNLVGQIPDHLSSLSKLVNLSLNANNLTGSIPAWIGKFSSLNVLSLVQNNFQGSIPSELGLLSSLGFFRLSENNLSGTIPPLIYNISSLYFFSVTQNRLHGRLPPDVGLTLPNLQYFFGGDNNFTGPIPVSLSNASQLQMIGFHKNGLTGTIPQNMASLHGLVKLNFAHNSLGNGKDEDLNFLNFLANCTSLERLSLYHNNFGGVLPISIANLSTQLQSLTMGWNMIRGDIPIEIGNLVNLNKLGLEYNYLGGPLPDALGKLQKLEELHLSANEFSGSIPSSLGNLTKLIKLFMGVIRFDGRIPPSLGNCHSLLLLNLSHNNLIGTIPEQVIGLSSLSIYLSLTHNFLIGKLPFEVGNLKNLAKLFLSENRLSAKIPTTLGTCLSLEGLYLEGNSFEGVIPQSLEMLRGLEEIDFSRNKFSGNIPNFLSKFQSLKHLNISYNDFEGKVPTGGIFANASEISIFGNDKLCGGVQELHLPTCSKKNPRSSRMLLALKIVIPVTSIVIFVLVLLYFSPTCFTVNISRARAFSLTASSFEDWQLHISYEELLKSTNRFSENNLIGSGSFGSVYKGVLPRNGAIVAVKVLNLQQRGASKSFINECNALKSIKHRNLLKIISVCSSIDHEGNDFKSLILEFMCNGSLDQWLHPKNDVRHQSKRLSFIQRLNIAIDVAYALEYLHHHCHTPIVHCDLKPSNILLDEDMVAHVGDFGLANFLFETSSNPSKTQTLGLKGSIGYIPPEYGMSNRVSTLGDIYSYGILLLEMFTGKRPIDEMFKDGLSIHKFIVMALPEHVMDIVDPLMFSEVDEEDADDEINKEDIKEIIKEYPHVNISSTIKDCVISLFQIGLSCSTTLPDDRMPTNVVVNKMQAIRDTFLKLKKEKGKQNEQGWK